MKIILRKEARKLGLKRYFTGKSCKHGHVTERLVDRGDCLECKRIKWKRWCKKNPEYYKEYEKEWRKSHRKNKCESQKKWRKKNLNIYKEYQKEWWKKNLKRIKEYSKKYQYKRTALQAKRKLSKIQRTVLWADKKLINIIYEIASNMSKLDGIKYDIDHIIPLQGKLVSGLHVETNLQIIPHTINCQKGNRYKI